MKMKKNKRITNSSSKKQSKQAVRVKSSVKAGFTSFHDAVKQGKI
jgi:hypothetical protein